MPDSLSTDFLLLVPLGALETLCHSVLGSTLLTSANSLMGDDTSAFTQLGPELESSHSRCAGATGLFQQWDEQLEHSAHPTNSM